MSLYDAVAVCLILRIRQSSSPCSIICLWGPRECSPEFIVIYYQHTKYQEKLFRPTFLKQVTLVFLNLCGRNFSTNLRDMSLAQRVWSYCRAETINLACSSPGPTWDKYTVHYFPVIPSRQNTSFLVQRSQFPCFFFPFALELYSQNKSQTFYLILFIPTRPY